MFKCNKCKCDSSPREAPNKVVVETRPVSYTNENGKTTEGYETVQEIVVCKNCVGSYDQSV